MAGELSVCAVPNDNNALTLFTLYSDLTLNFASSRCSEVNNSSEKTCSKSDNLESNKESHRKRLRVDSEGLSDSCNVKILRSMKHSAGEVLPRRSTRLVSKVIFSV